jgi:hypothetical protein
MISLSNNHGGCQCCSRPRPSNTGWHSSEIKHEKWVERGLVKKDE